jgi:hypothetical protein
MSEMKAFRVVVPAATVKNFLIVRRGDRRERDFLRPDIPDCVVSYRATRQKRLVTSPTASVNVLTSKPNNTPQAYPVVRRRDAQTGGLLFGGICHEI